MMRRSLTRSSENVRAGKLALTSCSWQAGQSKRQHSGQQADVGARRSRKNSGSHIDASHSRQPLVKGERLVRFEVNAVMPWIRLQRSIISDTGAAATSRRQEATSRRQDLPIWPPPCAAAKASNCSSHSGASSNQSSRFLARPNGHSTRR